MERKINLAKVRDLIIRDSSMTPLEKLVLIDLYCFAGTKGIPFPSEATLAQAQNRSTRWIREVLKNLKRKGWILGWKKRGYSMSNKYDLNEVVYFQNETTNRKPATPQIGTRHTHVSGSVLPPKLSQEEYQLSSESLPQLFEQVSKRRCTPTDISRLNKLSQTYSVKWVTDAVNELAKRNYPLKEVGLLELVLLDWKKDGKPQKKPVFHPCGKDGCVDGYTFNSASQKYQECNCRNDFEKSSDKSYDS